MKLRLSIGRRKLFIWLPYCLLLNRLAALIISEVLKANGVSIRAKNVYVIIKSLKKELKNNRKLTVFEIDTADGFKLSIRL